MKNLALYAFMSLLLLSNPSFALDNDINDMRTKSAERLERVLPVQWMAQSLIEDHAQSILPINHDVLSSYISSSMDWKMLQAKNIENLVNHFTTTELDAMAGENMSRTNIRSGIVRAVLLPETKTLIRNEIAKATTAFESAQAKRLGGFNLANQSFLEYQAKNGVYYRPAASNGQYTPVNYYSMPMPTYETIYYSSAR